MRVVVAIAALCACAGAFVLGKAASPPGLPISGAGCPGCILFAECDLSCLVAAELDPFTGGNLRRCRRSEYIQSDLEEYRSLACPLEFNLGSRNMVRNSARGRILHRDFGGRFPSCIRWNPAGWICSWRIAPGHAALFRSRRFSSRRQNGVIRGHSKAATIRRVAASNYPAISGYRSE